MRCFILSCLLAMSFAVHAEEPPSKSILETHPLIKFLHNKADELEIPEAELNDLLLEVIDSSQKEAAWKAYVKGFFKGLGRGAIFSAGVLVTIFLYILSEEGYEYASERLSWSDSSGGQNRNRESRRSFHHRRTTSQVPTRYKDIIDELIDEPEG